MKAINWCIDVIKTIFVSIISLALSLIGWLLRHVWLLLGIVVAGIVFIVVLALMLALRPLFFLGAIIIAAVAWAVDVFI